MADSASNTGSFGTVFTLAAWVLVLALLTWLFGNWEEHRDNPNRALSATGSDVTLQRNRQGHYLADGFINGKRVRFLVDTGATRVALPEAIAERLALPRLARGSAQTAGGDVDTWLTRIDEVRLGSIVLHDVPASINPRMAFDEVLLGMTFLKHLELVQRGDTLTLRQYAPR
ncbi:MAG: retroviral-like aspartic protease family protein [Gammaproteobacteria bacterium]|nr:retroviral-like aspartic protease family protein [Gammaproteobacteria bacterium]MCP5137409.1 retroviral-like aspartic protease family protein [Gammaproteobacteria bacterium]